MKYNKEYLRFYLIGMGYDLISINKFINEHSQNLKSLYDNVNDFKNWIKN